MTDNSRKYQLRNLGLPVIEDIEQLSKEIRLSESLLKRYLLFANCHYFTYEIPKKSGGARRIAQPSKHLKAIQSWILRNILSKLAASSASKGFEIGTSVYQNAFPHVGANVILSLDLENFFPSISANKVYGVFYSLGYNRKISSALTSLCTYEGFLPQGSPASPKLANLVCSKLDHRIQGYAGNKGMTYTRYADDLTLSSSTVSHTASIKSFIKYIVRDEGFELNENKTYIAGLRQKKLVTGLIVTNTKAGIGRLRYRILRTQVHHLFTGQSDDFPHVNGWLAFVYGIDKAIYKKLNSYIGKLILKYPASTAGNLIFVKK